MTSFSLVAFFTAIVHLLLKTSPPKISSVSALLSSPLSLSIPLKYSNHHHHRSNSLVSRYEYSHSRYTTNTRRRSTRCQMTIDNNDDDYDDDDDDISSSSSSSSNNDYNNKNYNNPIENETPEQRKNRMEMVRKIQKSFYQNEEPIRVPKTSTMNDDNDDNDGADNDNETTDFTIIKNLPLWRVQWTELPGSQNILNVHVPHYTNMFQKILQGNTISWGSSTSSASSSSLKSMISDNDDDNNLYFGHIYLPGGSENLDDEMYKLLDATDDTSSDVKGQETTMAALTGVLMKISDHRQMDDGRLVLIVQAMEKFKIHKVIRSHSPYAIADVKIYTDTEQEQEIEENENEIEIIINNNNNFPVVNHPNTDDDDDDDDNSSNSGKTKAESKAKAASSSSSSRAVAEAFAMHPFEVRTVTIEECEVHNKNGEVGIAISPLSNYDNSNNNNFTQRRRRHINTKISTSTITSTSTTKELVALAEYNAWVKLDELLKLLRIASQGEGVTVPVPSQILGLLPRLPRKRVIKKDEDNDDDDEEEQDDNDIMTTSSSSSSSSSSNQLLVWPTDFELDKIVSSFEGEQYINTLSPSAAAAVVGTYSKSPFVRVEDYCCIDDYNNNDDDNDSSGSSNDNDTNGAWYSPLRRAQRFSYVVWTLSESIALAETDVDRYSRQNILEIDSTKERLELAIEKMDKICILIRQVLRQTRGL